jgi:hypothetical protein
MRSDSIFLRYLGALVEEIGTQRLFAAHVTTVWHLYRPFFCMGWHGRVPVQGRENLPLRSGIQDGWQISRQPSSSRFPISIVCYLRLRFQFPTRCNLILLYVWLNINRHDRIGDVNCVPSHWYNRSIPSTFLRLEADLLILWADAWHWLWSSDVWMNSLTSTGTRSWETLWARVWEAVSFGK